MAEKEVKNEEVKVIKQAAATDEFDIFEESSSGITEENTKLFVTNYRVQHVAVPNGKGGVYDNYGVGFAVNINGQPVKQLLRIRPKDGRLYDNMAVIMSVPGIHFLEITKTTMRNSDTKVTTVIYGMQVSCQTDDGFSFICPLEAVSKSDKAIFENFKKQLIARGELE